MLVNTGLMQTLQICSLSYSCMTKIEGWLHNLQCHIPTSGTSVLLQLHYSHVSLQYFILNTHFIMVQGKKLVVYCVKGVCLSFCLSVLHLVTVR